MPINIFYREEPFTIAIAGQESGKYSISFFLFSEGKRRRLSCSVVLLCRVEDTSHEAVVGKLCAGALGSLMFSWARARLLRVLGCLLERCPPALGGQRSSGSAQSTPRVLAVPPAPGSAMYTCTQHQSNYPQAEIWQ